ncbi:MAG: LysR family transcriptional regulator [Parvibaculum sp.]|uniref:LysR family transcriptional regulator n=1 Tax=Parvibaculum sp. TaxID=2024848 RepID=UPI0025D504C1|nr:LysR family transcriptional regulator [Parvibaculum sp.]MCE9649628.1 LysR family transcriptional regulator [Parvibaculum sp.]
MLNRQSTAGSEASAGGSGWDAYRIFLAVAETQSLSGAGRKLKLSHATVGRHITALEKELGAKLFIREPVGYALTAAGERLRAEVEPMATAAERAARAAIAEDGEPRGTVRISVATGIAGQWLVPHLSEFHAQYPSLELEFVTEAWPASVRRREADIVIRLYGPGEENLVGRKIGRLGVAFYASKDYAAKHGLPTKREEWAEHMILGFAGSASQAEFSRWSAHVTRDAPTYFRFSSQIDTVHAVLAGAGIAALTCLTGDAYPQLMRISPDKIFSTTDMWLLAHPDLKDTPPVRAVMDFIMAKAKTDRAKLTGR